MGSPKVKVSIIILSWDTKQLLRNCLKSLRGMAVEVIVVDNGSTDGSPAMVAKEFPQVKLIRNKKNLGFGTANNQGMKIATSDYFLLLNSDTVVKDEAPLKMAAFLAKNPQAGAVGCRLLNPDGSLQPSAGPFPDLKVSFVMLFLEHWLKDLARTSFAKTTEVDWVMGAALMVRREVIKKAGWMDEGVFMYMDEVEWCYRIKKAGFKVFFYPGAEIVHLFGASSKSGRTAPILNIYRGLIYFYKKHCSDWQLKILKFMLKLKAREALILGWLTNNHYLKQTYAEALKIVKN
jgi:GT2 family glycosyltransferase